MKTLSTIDPIVSATLQGPLVVAVAIAAAALVATIATRWL